MTKEQAKELLRRYHDGELSPDEIAKLDAWYNKLAKHGSWKWEKNEKNQLEKQIRSAIAGEIAKSNKKGHSFLWAAAIFVFISSLSFLLFEYRNEFQDEFSPVVYLEANAPQGKQLTLTLMDGTTVWLNSGSKLKYPVKFNRSVREVELLEGEAYFDVKHHASDPFVVKTGQTRTNVLGTAFNIRSYPFFNNIQITVTRGKVAVSVKDKTGTGNAVILVPDEQVVIKKGTCQMERRQVNSADVINWTRGQYKFSNEPLRNVLDRIENVYQVHITSADTTLNEIRITSGFKSNEGLEDVLFAICKSTSLEYTRTSNRIILKRK